MPISAECPGCGVKVKAPDQLVGKTAKCPKCGEAIQVGGGDAAATIAVACDCGKRFRAKAALAGKRVKCPACGNPLTIPDGKPSYRPLPPWARRLPRSWRRRSRRRTPD